MRLPIVEGVSRRAALAWPALAALALTPAPPSFAISATTMAGKSRPELGVVLAEPVRQTGQTISGDVVLSGGTLATATFDSSWSLAEGGYYDIEAKSDKGDGAFVMVLPRGGGLGGLKKDKLAAAVFGVEGRYGAYGAPQDVKLTADTSDAGGRSCTRRASRTGHSL